MYRVTADRLKLLITTARLNDQEQVAHGFTGR
jgi:hypothetical protein